MSTPLLSVVDPYLRPQTSARNRAARLVWSIVRVVLFRPSPRICHAWRRLLLRLFGAQIGRNCHIYPGCEIWAPWNLICGDVVAIADGAIIYSADIVRIGSHATISRDAFVCGAGHDIHSVRFPTVSAPISIGAYCWVCARAAILPGVTLGEGAVLALGAVAAKDLEPWGIYVGSPARRVGTRSRHHD